MIVVRKMVGLFLYFIFLDIKIFFSEDFKASGSDSGSPSDSDSDSSGAKTASDASGDIAMARDAKKTKHQENKSLLKFT